MVRGPQATQAAEGEVFSQEERRTEPESSVLPSDAQLTKVRTPTAPNNSCFGSDCLHISLQGTPVGCLTPVVSDLSKWDIGYLASPKHVCRLHCHLQRLATHTGDGVWQGTQPATEEVVSKGERGAEPDFDVTAKPSQLTTVRMLPKHRLNICLHRPFLHGSLLHMYIFCQTLTL